jgi:hypothetical protein
MDGPHLRTLQKALTLLQGSKPRLAEALAVPVENLETYLQGKEPMPQAVFLDALDIVAGTHRTRN